ncbi:MAG: hypothetical protein GEU74_01255 [Nitriliruptorales bacterium]|nr:hypothetical protein [Nitriliruptorales bacterium]
MAQPTDIESDGATVGPVAKTAVVALAAVQLGAIVLVLVFGVLGDGALGNRLGAIPLAALFALPATLALLALRGRGALLLAAGVASLVLTVFPFSLHSFVFGPIGLIYLLAYAKLSTSQHDGPRSPAVAIFVPLLIVAAFLLLIVHDDPICYTKDASGEITIDRDSSVMTGMQTIESESNVVERGCSSDTVVWWEAAASLALSASALTAAVHLIRSGRREAGEAVADGYRSGNSVTDGT